MYFLKEQLTGTYDWSNETERSMFDTNANRRLFDRWNGHQTLFVINLFLQQAGVSLARYGHRAEQMLLEQLPLNAMSEMKVLQWLNAQSSKIIA